MDYYYYFFSFESMDLMAVLINKYGEVYLKCGNFPEVRGSAWRWMVTESLKQTALTQMRVKLRLGMR